jgi:hypothetical protein
VKRGRGFAASTRQRVKVMEESCIVCGRQPCDPAHVIDRSLGGCDDPLCVVPLCRERCHRAYDEGSLDLSVYLEPRWRKEQAHAVEHLGLWRAARRISNSRDAA